MSVLGIDVDDDLLAAWRSWFAPHSQLFCLDEVSADDRAGLEPVDRKSVPMELRDTFMAYGGEWALLDEPTFRALPQRVRRAMLDERPRGHRRVWWPDALTTAGDGPLIRYIRYGVTDSEHASVSENTWQRASDVLPQARRLAGTFARRSGPNCFGTVMGAAGVEGAADEWMTQEPFEKWLSSHTSPVRDTGHDEQPGTVLVWRLDDGLAVHALVTLGDGWALNKPSQAWCSPRFVWPLRRAINHSRQPAARVRRYALTR